MRWGSYLLLLTLLALGAMAAGRPDAYTVSATPLTTGPFTDAAPVSTLAAHTSVSVLLRKGGWYQVSLDSGQSGWLRMTALKFTSVAGEARNSVLVGLLGLFESGRSGANGTTSSTGVRGLNTGDIAAAKPDTAAVDGLKDWATTPDEARQYSAALPLRPYTVSYLGADGKPGKP
ncbi:MAG: SH3 domain-containing protein [Gammaproteobacteria bacterium]